MNIITKVQQPNTQVANNDEWVHDKKQRFLNWLEQIKTKKVIEYLEGFNLVEGTSIGGYRQVSVGNPDGTNNIAQFTISALNALVDVGKYELHYHLHDLMFDPDKDERNVRCAFDIVSARWQFLNWKNGTFTPSILNYPDRIAQYNQEYTKNGVRNPRFSPTMYKDLMDTLTNFVQKHTMLDEIINAVEKGARFTIILRNDADVSHWETNIKPYLDKPYAEYRAAYIARAAQRNTERALARVGDTQPAFVQEKKDERSAFIATLAGETQPVPITFMTYTSKVPQTRIFDPAQPDKNDAPYISFKALCNAPGGYKFERADQGKAAKESKGKEAK
jgi:hypothetical protein